MAFSKQPVNSTYQTKQVSLVKEIDSRGTAITKDSYFFNAYAEITKNRSTGENDHILIKRAGVSVAVASVGSSVRGTYYWKDQNKIYLAIGTSVYVYNATTLALVTTLAAVFGTSSGDVGFEEFLYTTNTTKLVVTDGTTLSTIDSSNVVVACVDADMPVHQPYPVFIDNRLFVLKVNSADIYQSDGDNPLAWTAGDFISAEMRPDAATRIASLNNYLVCFGSKSIEYFYDGANASGSVLSRNDSAVKFVGYVGGFAKFGPRIYFVGETVESLPDLYVLEDFKITSLGTEPVRRHLEAYATTLNGAIVSFNGHDFYVMTTTAATYTIELENHLWAPWGWQTGSRLPITFSLPVYTASGYKNYFVQSTDSTMYLFDDSLGQDNLVSFPITFVSENQRFDSMNRKFCNRLTVYADYPEGSQIITVETTDNDYRTWSTPQSLELFQDLPCIYRLGNFRQRAHRISYTGPRPLRIQMIEVDLNMGNT